MIGLGLALASLPVALLVYSYLGYPAILGALGALRRKGRPEGADPEWPTVSITVPAYNEEHQIAEAIESLLAIDYPTHLRQIMIVSDASTDRTDEIVRGYAARGVELFRQPERRGKTAAENAVRPYLRGEIVVNTDASIRIYPDAIRHLVRPFVDPEVGLASGRDVSTSASEAESNRGESGYVGYEMAVRDLETATLGIVGASGCLYAVRAELHGIQLPDHLSRDFASALVTHERGFRAVSVSRALCAVPRAPSLKQEYRRKVRTITRGMETLHHKRALLNPFRQGRFAWMLFSHKVCRWLLPWTAVLGAVGLVVLVAAGQAWAAVPLAAAGVLLAVGVGGWAISDRVALPRVVQMTAFAVMGNIAAMHATLRYLRGEKHPLWEPTRRGAALPSES